MGRSASTLSFDRLFTTRKTRDRGRSTDAEIPMIWIPSMVIRRALRRNVLSSRPLAHGCSSYAESSLWALPERSTCSQWTTEKVADESPCCPARSHPTTEDLLPYDLKLPLSRHEHAAPYQLQPPSHVIGPRFFFFRNKHVHGWHQPQDDR